MIAFNLVVFSALFANLDAAKLKNPKLTESLLQMDSYRSVQTSYTWKLNNMDITDNGTTFTKTSGTSSWTDCYAEPDLLFPKGSSFSWRIGGALSYNRGQVDAVGVIGFNEQRNTYDYLVRGGLEITYGWLVHADHKLSISRCVFGAQSSSSTSTCGYHHTDTAYQWNINTTLLTVRVNSISGDVEYVLKEGDDAEIVVATDPNQSSTDLVAAIGLKGNNAELYDVEFSGYDRVAVDECATGAHNCDTNAVCTDTADSWECECNLAYVGDGITCSAAGASGDPHFRGFDGSQYDFQGSPGSVYNLITDQTFQLNARFVESPTDGKTYMGALGLQAGSNKIVITPDVVIVNDVVVTKGDHVYLNQGKESSHEGLLMFDGSQVRVKTGSFQVDVKMAEQEGFVYLDVDAAADSHHLGNPHGVLGQTAKFMVDGTEPHPVYLSHKNVNAQGFLAGTAEDYIVTDGLLGSAFFFNRFGGEMSSNAPLAGRKFAFARALYQRKDV